MVVGNQRDCSDLKSNLEKFIELECKTRENRNRYTV
jgi:hypothetical protein